MGPDFRTRETLEGFGFEVKERISQVEGLFESKVVLEERKN